MKNWFPFSDYDFFGYLVSGFVLLFGIDYALTGGSTMLREQWTFVQIVLAVGVAYFAGQLIASPSSLLLEHLFARKILHPPIQVLLMDKTPGWFTKTIGRCVIGRYYEPLPAAQRDKIVQKAASDNNTTIDMIRNNSELVFGPAYAVARQNSDTRDRIDSFRNQYGLARNMAFTSLIVAGLFGWKAWGTEDSEALFLCALAAILFLGMLARFLKFYAAFASEVLRAYSYLEQRKQ